ncbi:MAG: hypothetical protein R2827_09290 [Bdellovibrionales bacterium]
MAPNFDSCIFAQTRPVDSDEQRVLRHVSVTTVRSKWKSPSETRFLQREGERHCEKTDEDWTIDFLTNLGWNPTFNIQQVEYTSSLVLQVVRRFTWEVTNIKLLIVGSPGPIFVRVAAVFSGNPNPLVGPGVVDTMSTVIFIEGEGLDFGGKRTITPEGETFSINHRTVTQEEWESLFGIDEVLSN